MWIPGAVLGVPALFFAGAAASVHCVLMCGAISVGQARISTRLGLPSALALVHAGRVSGYALLGGLAGTAGRSIFGVLSLPWLGLVLQACAAASLVLVGISLLRRPAAGLPCCRTPAPPGRDRLPPALVLFSRGLAWAALPCGLLYSLLLLCAFSGTTTGGASLAAAFALGGVPALALVGWSGARPTGPVISSRRAGLWLIGLGLAGLAATALLPASAQNWCRAPVSIPA